MVQTIAFFPAQPAPATARRLILVDMYWTRDKDPRVPLGHASLLAALQSEPLIETISVVAPVNQNLTAAAMARRILHHTTGLAHDTVDIGLGAYIWNEAILQDLLPLLRQHFAGRIILGGPQVSYVDSGLEQLYPDADIFIRGFAETALAAAVRSSRPMAIPGVHYAGAIGAAVQAATVLATLPSPLLGGQIPLAGQAFIRWEPQRGCQFACSFCQHRQKDDRSPVLRFPIDRVMEEVDLICRTGVEEVAVLDPIFKGRKEAGHAERVLERFIANGYRGRLALQCRAEFVTEAFLDLVQQLDVCLEFGLQTIHKNEQEAIGRPNNMDKVAWALAATRQRGIEHEVSLIYGLPEQTLASFHASVRWCLEQEVPVIKAFPLLLLRGTKLEQDRAQWQLVVDDEIMPEVVASSTFSRADWHAMTALSQQLSDTEGGHPAWDVLAAAAVTAIPDRARFQPGAPA